MCFRQSCVALSCRALHFGKRDRIKASKLLFFDLCVEPDHSGVFRKRRGKSVFHYILAVELKDVACVGIFKYISEIAVGVHLCREALVLALYVSYELDKALACRVIFKLHCIPVFGVQSALGQRIVVSVHHEVRRASPDLVHLKSKSKALVRFVSVDHVGH